jgi:hypothetical protein
MPSRSSVPEALIQQLPARIAFLGDVEALGADIGKFGGIESHISTCLESEAILDFGTI